MRNLIYFKNHSGEISSFSEIAAAASLKEDVIAFQTVGKKNIFLKFIDNQTASTCLDKIVEEFAKNPSVVIKVTSEQLCNEFNFVFSLEVGSYLFDGNFEDCWSKHKEISNEIFNSIRRGLD